MTEFFPRKCSQTGEGMDSGWVAYDGAAYFKYKEDAVAWVIEEEKCSGGVLDPEINDQDALVTSIGVIKPDIAERIARYNNYSEDDWLEFAYNMDMLYWTTWECELNGDVNYLADGTEIICTKQ